MKLILPIALATVFVAGTANAGNIKDNYLSLKLGLASADAEYLGDSFHGAGWNIALGSTYRSNRWLYWRYEGELRKYSFSEHGFGISPLGLSFNFYSDFGPKEWTARPYLGAGLGMAFVNSDGDEDTGGAGISWQIQMGATFKLSKDFALDAGLRHDVVSLVDYSLSSNTLFAGIRWQF